MPSRMAPCGRGSGHQRSRTRRDREAKERAVLSSSDSSTAATSSRPLLVYLNALVGREPSGLLEVRWRHGDGMKRRVYRVADELVTVAAAIVELGARTDVYVGCAPRHRRAGGLDALQRVWILWADCDTPEAVAALEAFRPAPALVVRSGSGENRHAYWTLTGPLGVEAATAANRRLAHELGADSGAVTTAATILRPPGTGNFKHSPPADVVAERLQPWRRVSATKLVGDLVATGGQGAPTVDRRRGAELASDDVDALRQVAPDMSSASGVLALSGRLAQALGLAAGMFAGQREALGPGE